MKKSLKILSVLLCLVTAAALASCGKKNDADTATTAPETTADGSALTTVEGGTTVKGSAAPTTAERTLPHTTDPDSGFGFGNEDKNKYSNSFIGISCTLSSDWTYYSEKQIAQINDQVMAALDEDADALMKKGNVVYDMFAVSKANDTINVALENLKLTNNTDITEDYYAQLAVDNTKKSLTDAGATDVSIKKTTFKFAGKNHPGLELSLKYNGKTVYENVVMIKCNGFMANISFAVTDKSKLSSLLSSFSAV